MFLHYFHRQNSSLRTLAHFFMYVHRNMSSLFYRRIVYSVHQQICSLHIHQSETSSLFSKGDFVMNMNTFVSLCVHQKFRSLFPPKDNAPIERFVHCSDRKVCPTVDRNAFFLVSEQCGCLIRISATHTSYGRLPEN